MDLVFNQIRMGLFYMDHSLIESNIARAKQMLDEGGDWDRRNRLKVYEGLYALSVRDFSRAANLFLETVSTFTSYELMSYVDFVTYTVLVGVIALDRKRLLEKVVQGSEILEVLHDLPAVRAYLTSFYDCHYGDFFANLAQVEQTLKRDRYLNPHYAFYVREMKASSTKQISINSRQYNIYFLSFRSRRSPSCWSPTGASPSSTWQSPSTLLRSTWTGSSPGSLLTGGCIAGSTR